MADMGKYRVRFYKDADGKEPVTEYLESLIATHTKDGRIRARKIQDYIKILGELGTYAPDTIVKHIEDDLYELRPGKDRVLFVAWYKNGFVLLHSFPKKTQKTPEREKERARREFKDLQERGLDDEE